MIMTRDEAKDRVARELSLTKRVAPSAGTIGLDGALRLRALRLTSSA